MKRQRGASLAACLLGLALGLLVLQALCDTLASLRQTVLRQRALADALQAQDIAQAVLRAVARQPVLRVSQDSSGEELHADFIADGAPGACGDLPPADASHHAYRLRLDASGTLRCGVDKLSPQPVADGIGRWRLEFIEDRGTPGTPGLRRVDSTQVRDWRRVLLLRACLGAPGGASAEAGCHWAGLAAPGSGGGS